MKENLIYNLFFVENFITTKVANYVHAFIVGVVLLFTSFALVVSLFTGNFYGAFGLILFSAVFLFFMRLFFEMSLVFFSMNEKLKKIAESTKW